MGQEYNNGGLPLKIGDAISHVLGVNWTSSHHTPVDVVLGAFAHERLGLKESMDNSELGGAVIEALGVRPEEGMHFTADYAQEGCNLA